MRRHHGHPCLPLLGDETSRCPINGLAPVSNGQERTDQTSDHGVTERICPHMHHQNLSDANPAQLKEFTNGGGASPLLTKSGEIVLTHEELGRRIHPLFIKWRMPFQGESTIKGFGDAITDAVGVATPDGGESRIKIVIDVGDIRNADIFRQRAVNAVGCQLRSARHVDVRHLPARVDTGIGATSARDVSWLVHEIADDAFEFTLNRTKVRLLCPTMEIGSVIGDVEADANQPAPITGNGLIGDD
jgi:hypothetical protein